VEMSDVPQAEALRAIEKDRALQLALAGGDDYELCFTAPPGRPDEVRAAGAACDVAVTRVGRIVEGSELILAHADGRPAAWTKTLRGFDHFA
jgi:thiamine-monophosphate kinase